MSDREPLRRPGGRSTRVRKAVIDASHSLISEHGIDGISIAAVAARARVHESSIYRRWGSRENLVVAVLLDEAEEQLPVPDTGSLREDLVKYTALLVAYLCSPNGGALDRVMAAAGDDPHMNSARFEYWEARYARSTQMFARAVARGELSETVDHRLAIEMLVAPLHFKVVMTRQPLDRAYAERVVDALLGGLDPTVGRT